MNDTPLQADEMQAILSAHPLFAGLSPALPAGWPAGCAVREYAPGEALCRAGDAPGLWVLASGCATVYTVCGGSDFVLRSLRAGDVFGAAGLFASSGPVTVVTADKASRALYMPEAVVRHLIENNPAFALRYITFLSDRIRFLNKRLACLTAGTAAARLAAWLDTTVPEGAGAFPLPVPMNRLCDLLNVGRASLYRAADELEARGFLVRDGKTVTLPDRAGMCAAYGLG